MRIPLPTDYTVFRFLIPSMGKEKRFRPFTVKENKALLAAQSTDDDVVMIDTLARIITSCCLDELDVKQLALFDVEYLLIKLRSISISKDATLIVTCNDFHDGLPEQTRKNEIVLDLDNVEVTGLDRYKTSIKLSDTMTVKMKTPSLDVLKNIKDSDPNDSLDQMLDNVEHNIAAAIDCIYTADEVINVEECSMHDIRQWIEALTEEQFLLLKEYFDTIPRCRIKMDWTCPVCGKRNVQYVEGLHYFFS